MQRHKQREETYTHVRTHRRTDTISHTQHTERTEHTTTTHMHANYTNKPHTRTRRTHNTHITTYAHTFMPSSSFALSQYISSMATSDSSKVLSLLGQKPEEYLSRGPSARW